MKIKFTDRQYHVQDNGDAAHKYVRMYWNKNQLIALPFCGRYFKPCGARGMSNNYHLRFDSKLGNGVCTILRIPCDCDTFTSMIYKPWIFLYYQINKSTINL